MRILVLLAVLMPVVVGITACFHHHQKQVLVEPIGAPPMK
jgi:hypothetical protein